MRELNLVVKEFSGVPSLIHEFFMSDDPMIQLDNNYWCWVDRSTDWWWVSATQRTTLCLCSRNQKRLAISRCWKKMPSWTIRFTQLFLIKTQFPQNISSHNLMSTKTLASPSPTIPSSTISRTISRYSVKSGMLSLTSTVHTREESPELTPT